MHTNRTKIGLRALVASSAVVAALLLAAPGFAADAAAPAATDQSPAVAPQNAAPATSDAAKPKMMHRDRIEARIANLHRQLHITAAQEPQWSAVAQAMRDSAHAVGDLVKERQAKSVRMTAVDDLHSYEAIADAHADGLKKLIPAFETLYASMSDDQKKVADTMFRHVRKPSMEHKT
jgi:hypothetical protein